MNELAQRQIDRGKESVGYWEIITRTGSWKIISLVLWYLLFGIFLLRENPFLLIFFLSTPLLAVWIYLSLSKALRIESNNAKTEKLRADEYGDMLKDRFGFHTGKLDIEVAISNYDGDCNTKWLWTEIRRIHPESPISIIPERMYFSTPRAAFSEYPKIIPEYADRCEIEFLSKETNRCLFDVRVKEDLNEIGFGYTASIDRAFYMHEEDLTDETFKEEWFGFYIVGIIASLCARVTFPRHYMPDVVQPDVYVGTAPTGTSNIDEINRILGDGGFKIEPGAISIIVKKPKLGYLYCLRWRPLPEVLVNGIRIRGQT